MRLLVIASLVTLGIVVIVPSPASACGPIDIVNPYTYPLGVGDPIAYSGCPVCIGHDPVLGTHACRNSILVIRV